MTNEVIAHGEEGVSLLPRASVSPRQPTRATRLQQGKRFILVLRQNS